MYPQKEVEVKFDLDRPGDVIDVLALLLDKREGLSAMPSGGRALENVEYIDLKDPDSPAVLETKKEFFPKFVAKRKNLITAILKDYSDFTSVLNLWNLYLIVVIRFFQSI